MHEDFAKMVAFAIEQETNAKNFYSAIAAKSSQGNIQEMFTKLAAEEERHEKLLTEVLEKGKKELNFSETEDYGISETVEPPEISEDMSLADVFAIAMKNEEKAMIMYQQMAKDAPTSEIRNFFAELAKMEQGHKLVMEQSYTDVAYGEAW